jgi:hypothetical protein
MIARGTYCRLPEQSLEEPRRGLRISAAPDKNVENDTVLIHCTPEIMKLTLDPDEHLVQIPLVAGLRPAAT